MRSSVRLTKTPQFYCCAALLCLTAVGYHVLKPTEQGIPLARPLSELPIQLGEWTGREAKLGADAIKEIIKLTGSKDRVSRQYAAGPGRKTYLYITYHGTPDVFSPHSPEWCYSTVGWKVQEKSEIEIPSGGDTILATQTLLVRNAEQKVVQHWYIDTGKLARSCSYSRLAYLTDANRRQRRYVIQVHIASDVGASAVQSYENCRELSAALWPELRKHLPRPLPEPSGDMSGEIVEEGMK